MWIEAYNGVICQGAIVGVSDWKLDDMSVPLAVVLTNECDLTNDKCGYIILMGLLEANFILKSSKEFKSYVPHEFDGDFSKLSTRQKKSITDYFEGFIHNKDIRRYYFLDGDPLGLPTMLIDFQLLKSIPYKEVNNLSVLGRIKSPFKEQMIMHFAGYSSRIPSERIAGEAKQGIIDSLLNG